MTPEDAGLIPDPAAAAGWTKPIVPARNYYADDVTQGNNPHSNLAPRLWS